MAEVRVTVTEVQQSSNDTEAEPAGPAKKTKRKRKRERGLHSTVTVPAVCLPALQRLKQELGLRTAGDTLIWLFHQVRPELVPGQTPRLADVVHKPACMPRPDEDKQVSMCHLTEHTPSYTPARRTTVRATVVQASTVFFDTPATLDKAERLIAGAAAFGSELVVFPEAFLGGYPRCVTFDTAAPSHSTDTVDFQKYYASAIDVPGLEVDKLAKMASKYKVHLVMGVVERSECHLFSTVLYFDSQGQHIGQHRKLMPMASESSFWCHGEKSSLPIYETSIGKIGGFICWDNKSPLLRAELYSKGVEIYCAPNADAGEAWKASMTHVALEGGCFVLSANQFCRRKDYPLPPGDSHCDISMDAITSAGGSIIVSPSGTILAGPNYRGECLISADLDLGEIAQAKIEYGRVNSNMGPKHVDSTSNGPTPVAAPRCVKIDPELASYLCKEC